MQQPFTFLLQGGLDLVTPRIAVKPGLLLAGQNHESSERGYSRIGGFERFDGQLKPSEARYWYAEFTAGNLSLAGNILTGATSGAVARLTGAPTLLSGSYGAGTAAGYIFLRDHTGTLSVEDYIDGEGLQTGGITRMTLTATPVESGAPTDAIHAAAMAEEMERRRSEIEAPIGSGRISGIWTYAGGVYCFRNNAGGTATDMWQATTTGWAQIALGETVNFTLGTAEFVDGETLTRGGVTATIVRVILQSGTWSGGDAVGYIVIKARSGGNYTAGVGTSASGSATLSGAQAAITINPNATFRFVNHTFSGAANDVRMYGANRVDRAFEFDGTDYVPIRLPGFTAAQDKPLRIAQFANHLFLAYAQGNILFSEIGAPLQFAAIGGSGEFNFGTRVTEWIGNASTSLVLFGLSKSGFITGSDVDTFNLQTISDTSGAKDFSVVMINEPYYVDDRGIRKLTTTSAFGDWAMGSVSETVAPLFENKIADGVAPAAAFSVKRRNQYRIYFDDGTGLSVYLGRKYPEILSFSLPISVEVVVSGEDAEGNEILFAGADDGFVYQIDAGYNFDGEPIEAWLFLHFVAPNGNANNYRWHKAIIECDAATTATEAITFVAEYSYGDGNLVPSAEGTSDITGVGGFWDVMEWDAFIWDAPVQGQATAYLNGFGFNCGLAVRSELTYEAPYTLSSLRLLYSQRGLIR